LKWTNIECKGELPSERHRHASILHDGKMFTFGGINSKTICNDLFVLDLENYTWKEIKLKNALPKKYGHQMKLNGDLLCISGGFPINHDENFIYQLDLGLN
jgi:N-acetylneuraminic acid mutarotase